MKNKNEIKTGLLVIIGIGLFIFGFSYLKSNDIFVSDRTFYSIYDDVEGVVNGTTVTVNGFPVGSITDISFFKNNSLLVKFRVENDIKFSVNSIAQIYETGLIGGKALAIIPAMDNSRVAVSLDTLKSSVAPGLTELVNDKLTPLQENIETMILSANDVLEKINLEKIQFVGYAFQIEMKFKAYLHKFKITEVPVIFTDRTKGESKMSGGIISEAIFGVISMKFKSLFTKYEI